MSRYNEAIEVQRFLMVLFGIWPKEHPTYVYKTYGFTVSFLLQIVFILPCLADISLDSEHAAESSYYLFCSITVLSYLFKVTAIYLKKDSFRRMLRCLRQPIFTSYEGRYESHMKRTVSVSIRVRKLIHYPCVFLISFIAIYPAFDRTNKRPLPFSLPLKTKDVSFSSYCLLYFLEVVAAAICASNNVTLDTLAYSLIALGTAQLAILGEKLKHSNFVGDAESLKNCIEYHNAIIEYVDAIEDTYTYAFLAQFVTSLIVIGVTGFSFIVIPVDNILFAVATSYFIAAMMEVSMYCIFGDELMVKSLKINEACYASEWTDCDLEIRKMMLVIMERSKKPLVLTARKFLNLSRESLLAVCKTSYSYFALLRRMYGHQ